MAEYVNEVRLGVSKILEGLKISPGNFLDDLPGRSICPKCQKSRKYFCYTCYVPMDEIADKIPKLKLPLKVDIIKHPREVDGKSTAVHAAVLAPDDVSMYTYPYIPTYEKEKVLMIFPGKKSVTFSQLRHQLNLKSHYRSDSDRLESEFSKVMSNRSSQLSASNVLKQKNTLENDSGELNEGKCNLLNNCDYYTSSQTFPTSSRMDSSSGSRLPLLNHCLETPDHKKYDLNKMKLNSRLPFERVILIDSTWNQVRGIRKDERLEGILRVELTERESCFWRFQRGKPRTYLSTIESIYYFLVDAHVNFIDDEYDGEYDDLLFFFKYMFLKIHSLYDPTKLRVYQQRPSTF